MYITTYIILLPCKGDILIWITPFVVIWFLRQFQYCEIICRWNYLQILFSIFNFIILRTEKTPENHLQHWSFVIAILSFTKIYNTSNFGRFWMLRHIKILSDFFLKISHINPSLCGITYKMSRLLPSRLTYLPGAIHLCMLIYIS